MDFLPRNSDPPFEISETVSAPYRHLIMPYAYVREISGTFGKIISQVIKRPDYVLYQHHFIIDAPCTIIASMKWSSLSILYMLRGNPYVQIPGLDDPPLQEGWYRLFYLPIVKKDISLTKGFYQSVRIAYPVEGLFRQIGDRERLKRLLQFAIDDGRTIRPYLNGKIDKAIKARLHYLVQCTQKPPDRWNHLDEQARLALLQYLRRHHTIQDDLERMEKYICENLNTGLEARQLARHFGKNENELHRLFKLRHEMSPYQYIQKHRIQLAEEYLINTNLPIKKVAEALGYEDISGFHKFFKNHKGCAPSVFRRNARKSC